MDYKDKLKQANREAVAAVIGLAATIVVWAVLGFGVAATGIVVFSTPLWVFTGCVGTFAFAVAVAVFMARVVMVDVGLDDEPTNGDGGDWLKLNSGDGGDCSFSTNGDGGRR